MGCTPEQERTGVVHSADVRFHVIRYLYIVLP